MSGRTAKAGRREEEAEKQEYLLRKDTMLKDIKDLSVKYRIDLVPVMKYTDQGIFPLIAFVDVKEQYEKLTEEAKKSEEAKKNNEILKSNGEGKITTHLET